jgi:hypothetical protein
VYVLIDYHFVYKRPQNWLAAKKMGIEFNLDCDVLLEMGPGPGRLEGDSA